MPFIRGQSGEESFDDSDIDPEQSSGDAEYVPPDAYRYEDVTEELLGTPRELLDILLAAGATEFRVNYDGGCDEGFSHPDGFFFGDKWRSVDEVVSQLTTPQVLARLGEEKDTTRFHHAGNPPSDQQIIRYAVDELAEELAARLLGRGYGTGEYTMYGAFTADLKTLEMTDDPVAVPRDGMA